VVDEVEHSETGRAEPHHSQREQRWSPKVLFLFRTWVVYLLGTVLIRDIARAGYLVHVPLSRFLPEAASNNYFVHDGLATRPLGFFLGWVPHWYVKVLPDVCDLAAPAHYCWIFRQLWFLLVGFAVAALWTALDRRSTDYARLARILRLTCRYVLAISMMGFGVMKMNAHQFGTGVDGFELTLPLDGWSLGRFMWASMGVSRFFQFFCGFGEFLGAVLLLFANTATLGAIVVFIVCVVVLTLNWAHHIQINGLLWPDIMLAVTIVWPELRRLGDFYVRNRVVRPERYRISAVPRFIWWPVKAVALWAILYKQGLQALLPPPFGTPQYASSYDALRPSYPLSSLYRVEQIIRGRDTIRPRWDDTTSWQYADIGSAYTGSRAYGRWKVPDAIDVYLFGGLERNYATETDTTAHRFSMTPWTMVTDSGTFRMARGKPAAPLFYSYINDSTIELRTSVKQDTTRMVLRKLASNAFPLKGGRRLHALR
jgi:uncharacterized membrane protein YphA (DoxX/SURF4 family)